MDMVVETDPSGRFARSSEVLGKGSSKTVYKAFDRVEGREVAWNQAVLTSGSMEAAHGLLHTEVKVLKSLKHRNIMNFYASWVDDEQGTINFVTEYFHSGTLKRHRLYHKSFDLNLVLLKRWAWQILQGLVYLHGHNPCVIHRDLKCDNIFIHGVTGEVKIGDLGLARLMEENLSMCHTCLGTPEFMAPELYKEEYNEKVDIYSFGMCILELVTMSYPYSECKTACQIYRNVTEGVPPQALATIEDAETRDFIEICIRYDHNTRPSARQLVKHKFFDNVRAPSPNSKVCHVPSRPELALDESSMSEATLEGFGGLQSSNEGFSGSVISDASGDEQDEKERNHKPHEMLSRFEDEISDMDEGGRDNLVRDSATSTEGHSVGGESSVLKRQFSIQHRGSAALPFVDVVNFELCFGDPDSSKRLLFSFDVMSDTVEDVGLELEEEYSLTPEETVQFTDMLKKELERVLHTSPRATGDESTTLGAFGSILVSMSLDDWTNPGLTRSGAGRSSHSGHFKAPHSGHFKAAQSGEHSGKPPLVSLKINVEKSAERGLGRRSSFQDAARRRKSNESEASRKRISGDSGVSVKSGKGRNSFCFESAAAGAPGGNSMWNNLVSHLRGGAVSLAKHSMTHRRYKLARLCGDNRVLSQDTSTEPSACTDEVEAAEEGSELQLVTTSEKEVEDVPETPLVETKRRNPLMSSRSSRSSRSLKSLTPVLNQVRTVAGAAKHIKAAAVILCRNSLEGKRIFFEIRGKGMNKCKDVPCIAPSVISDDNLRWSEEPDPHRLKGCAPCMKPDVVKRGKPGSNPFGKVAKLAQMAVRWRNKARGNR